MLARPVAWNTLEDSISRPNIVCHDQFHVLVTVTPAINALLFSVIEEIMVILVRVKKHCIQFCGYFANQREPVMKSVDNWPTFCVCDNGWKQKQKVNEL